MSTGLRDLARQRLWRRWTLASFLARLPGTMTLLALVLAGEEATGSLAVGAQLAGVATVVAGVAAPWRGRRLDRAELRGGLQRACLATGAVFLAQALALALDAPVWALFALAAVQGVAFAAISGGFRALLVPVVPPEDLARANTMEAVFVEVAFVAGPTLAGLLGLVVGARGVLLAMAAASFASILVARRLPRLQPAVGRPSAAPWRVPAARAVFGLGLSLGVCVGLFESALPARAAELGFQAASGGLLLAFTSIGSAAGGLFAAGQRDALAHVRGQACALLVAFALLLVPVAAAGNVWWLGAALLLAGVPIAPLNALGSLVLQQAVPPGRQAEGFAVYIAAILVGAGLGNGLTGLLLDDIGAQALLLLSVVLPLAAAAAVGAAVLRRGRSDRSRAMAGLG